MAKSETTIKYGAALLFALGVSGTFCNCGNFTWGGNSIFSDVRSWSNPQKGKFINTDIYVKIPTTAGANHLLGKVRKVSYQEYDPDESEPGTFTRLGSFEFDTLGRLLSLTEMRDDSLLLINAHYRYEESGPIKTASMYVSGLKMKTEVSYFYNNKDKRILACAHDLYNDKTDSIRYLYDSLGRLSEVTNKWNSSGGGSRTVINYDSRGFQTGVLELVESAIKTMVSYNDSGQITTIKRYSTSKQTPTLETAPDTKGSHRELFYIEITDTLLSSVEFTYDAWGNTVSEVSYLPGRIIDTLNTAYYSYTYDKRGNPATIVKNGLPRKNKVRQLVSQRTYLYYE